MALQKPKLTQNDLLDLKEEIDQAKTKKAEYVGQKNALMKQLKDNWGCTTLEQAEKKLASIEKQINELKESIEEKTQALQDKYFTEDESN